MKTRLKVGYAVGDLGLSITYFALGFFFLFYLTDIVEMSAAAAGTVVLIGKLWDGVNDPLIGMLSDRTRSRMGRKRVYLIYGAVPFAVSFALLWWLPDDASSTVTFWLAVGAVLLFATTYSIVAVPYMALVPILTDDYDERTQLIGFRAMLSSVGTITGGGIALVVSAGDGLEASLRGMSIGFGTLAAVLVLVAARSVRGLETGREVEITRVPLSRFVAMGRDPNVAVLMAFRLFGAIATGALTASLPFFAEHVVGDTRISAVGLAVYVITSAALVPWMNRLTHRYDKRHLLLAGNTIAALLLASLGLLIGTDATVVFVVGAGLLGAAMSAYLLIPGSLVPDLVDYYEFTHEERHESVFFGIWLTILQVGFGVAGLVLGGLLEVFGYDGSLESQTASGIVGVRLAFGVVPGVFLLASALVLLRYRITRDVVNQAQAALSERRRS